MLLVSSLHVPVFVNNHSGGAIDNFSDGGIICTRCTFRNNYAFYPYGGNQYACGGAIHAPAGSSSRKIILTDCTFIDNYAVCGGALHIANPKLTVVQISNTTFTRTNAALPTDVHIEQSPLVIMENVLFSDNNIGALSIASITGQVSLNNVTFSNNNNSAGATVSFTNLVSASVQGCTFDGNQAQQGGALSIQQSNVNISNSVFTNNQASKIGGGIYVYPKTSTATRVSIDSSLFENNVAQVGGGIYISVGTNVTVSSSIFKNK